MLVGVSTAALLVGLYFMWRVVKAPAGKQFSFDIPVPGGAKATKAKGIPLVIFNGAIARYTMAERCEEGVMVNGVIYEQSMLLPILAPDGAERYMLGAERVPLATHEALEQARRRILKGRFLKPGGDIADMMRIASSVAIIVVGLFVWLQIGSLGSSLNDLSARTQAVEEILSKPLNIVPVKNNSEMTTAQPESTAQPTAAPK